MVLQFFLYMGAVLLSYHEQKVSQAKKRIWMKVYMIHSDAPQSRPVVIIDFTHVVRPSVRTYVRPHFSQSSKTK